MSLGTLIALIIIALMLALSLKSKNPEISGMISVAICICIIFMCIDRISIIANTIKEITRFIKIDNIYISILIKLIGIAYICEFASGISKDAGYGAVATEIELMGKLSMLIISLPVLLHVIDTITNLL